MPEMLDIVDENGVPHRSERAAHDGPCRGLRHRTSHVWIVRHKNGRVQVLFADALCRQDSYPGCYDISSAGHPRRAQSSSARPCGSCARSWA